MAIYTMARQTRNLSASLKNLQYAKYQIEAFHQTFCVHTILDIEIQYKNMYVLS